LGVVPRLHLAGAMGRTAVGRSTGHSAFSVVPRHIHGAVRQRVLGGLIRESLAYLFGVLLHHF